MMTEDDITRAVIGIAVEIHRQLGPGLLESAYQGILVEELKSQGFPLESQRLVPVRFNGRVYEHGFRLDLLVDSRVVIEVKSTERPAPVHARQLLTYLRCLDLRVGLVVNLGMTRAIDGIVRVVNNRAGTRPPDG
jgi:iron complex transport system substrate-binding protein